MVKNAALSESGAAGDRVGAADSKQSQQHQQRQQQSSRSARQPNIALIEAKKRAKILKMQQEQQLQRELVMISSEGGGSASQAGRDQLSIAVSSLGAVKDIYQNVRAKREKSMKRAHN